MNIELNDPENHKWAKNIRKKWREKDWFSPRLLLRTNILTPPPLPGLSLWKWGLNINGFLGHHTYPNNCKKESWYKLCKQFFKDCGYLSANTYKVLKIDQSVFWRTGKVLACCMVQISPWLSSEYLNFPMENRRYSRTLQSPTPT